MPNRMSNEIFQKRFKEERGDELKCKSVYINMKTKIETECLFCGYVWLVNPNSVLNKKTHCPKCMNQKKSLNLLRPLNDVLEEIELKYPGKFEYLGGYDGTNKHCNWKCKFCSFEWSTTPRHIIDGTGCPSCALIRVTNSKKMTPDELQRRLNNVHPGMTFDKNTLINMRTPVTFYCPEHGEVRATPDNMLREGCIYCGRERIGIKLRKDVLKVLEELKEVDDGTIIIDLDTYKGSSFYADFTCTKCGYHWSNRVVMVTSHKIGCPKCRSSKLEKPIFDLLSSLHCDFYYNKPLMGCRRKGSSHNLRPDFLFKKYPLVFELDGIQHSVPVNGYEKFNIILKNDSYKNEYFKQINYILIRASDDDVIEYATQNHVTLTKLKELINKGIKPNGEIDLEVFRPYDFNREES